MFTAYNLLVNKELSRKTDQTIKMVKKTVYIETRAPFIKKAQDSGN